MGQQGELAGIDTGIPSRLLVAAQSIHVAGCNGVLGEPDQDHSNNQNDQEGDREAADIQGDLLEAEGETEDGLTIAHNQRDAAEDGVGTQGNNEGMQLEQIDQGTIYSAHDNADQDANKNGSPNGAAAQQELCADGAAECCDGTYGKIDTGKQDGEEFTKGQHGIDGALHADLLDVVDGEEILGGSNGETDQDQQQDAQSSEFLPVGAEGDLILLSHRISHTLHSLVR